MNNATRPSLCAARVRGFTLIELMITVAIVAILAAIAYPSYQSHVMRTHRAAAKACLSQYAQWMERFYTTKLTYEGAAPGELGCSKEGGLNQRYTFAPSNLQRRTYTVTASAAGIQKERDTDCGNLTIDQAGNRGASGTKGDACWN